VKKQSEFEELAQNWTYRYRVEEINREDMQAVAITVQAGNGILTVDFPIVLQGKTLRLDYVDSVVDEIIDRTIHYEILKRHAGEIRIWPMSKARTKETKTKKAPGANG
jgi:hypothetical protein